MHNKERFQVKTEHIKLLRNAYVRWEDDPFGAPAIDSKRPYGNSSVHRDIAKILDITPELPEDEFSDAQIEQMDKLHKETETALQIFLRTGEMKCGAYVSNKYYDNWREDE